MYKCRFELDGNIFKPLENEDVFFVDTKGDKDVTSLAIIVDGTDGRKKRSLPNGKEVALPDIVFGKKTAARIWADLLQSEIAVLASNGEKTLSEIVFEATKKANEKFPKQEGVSLLEKLDPLQVPAASVLISRINNGVFESFSNGDCGMIVRYQDGTIENFIGNEANSQAICFDSSDNTKPFARAINISRDKRRNLSTYANQMWSLDALAYNIQNVAMFSAGIKPAFMNEDVVKKFISAPNKKDGMKLLEILSVLGTVLKTNQDTIDAQSARKVQKFDLTDRTALFFNLVDERE